MRNEALIALALALIAGSASAGDPCVSGQSRSGADTRLPCVWHNPIPAEHTEVFFDPRSADLAVEAKATLDRQAAVLQKFPHLVVELIGYADTVEAPTSREKAELAQRRAEAARDFLAARGVPVARMTAIGRDYAVLVPREESAEVLARMRLVRTDAK